MENENKDFQGSLEESEMREKVRQDISAKVEEAAAELQEDIDSAAADAPAQEAGDEVADEDAMAYGEQEDGFEGSSWEDATWSDETFVEPPKEPKKVTMTVSSLVLSLIGTAIVGALILFMGMKIPGWIEQIPEGKKVATVDGATITDLDMKYYIYYEAMNYYQSNIVSASSDSSPADYDWSTVLDDGRTAEQTVKDSAVDSAVKEALLMNAGDKNGAEWDPEQAKSTADMQTQNVLNIYGEELLTLNVQMQGIDTLKQYTRKIVQAQHMQAVEADMEANPDKYYPEDTSALEAYRATDGATVKHILIEFPNTDQPADGSDAAQDGAAPATNEEARAKAEEILARAKNGEDFDGLVKEFNQDSGQTDAGYTFGPNEMDPAFEEAAFNLGLNEISDLVETSYGYHIIKRIPGRYELEGYWKDQAKINVNQKAIDKMSVHDILAGVDAASEAFQTKYSEYQNANSNSSAGN